jgi:hypothetical protein
MAAKQPRPFFFCSRCHTPTRNAAAINGNARCQRVADGKGTRCGGKFRSALALKDWLECPSCKASGRLSDRKCDDCRGFGWLILRRR